MNRLSILLTGILLFAFSCKEPESNIIHLNKENFSPKEEKIIGAAIKDEVLSLPESYPILDPTDYSEAYKYVRTLFQTLRNTSLVTQRNFYEWSFHIIEDDNMKSAFMLPGGHFFVYTGLLKTLENESEFVSLMAHEMYYAENGYAVTRLKEEYSDLADILLENSDLSFMTDLAKDLPFISFSANEVGKADQFAIDLLCPFQFDATGLKSILMNAETSNKRLDWLDIRPGLANRVAAIEAEASDCGEGGSIFAERYQSFKTKLLP